MEIFFSGTWGTIGATSAAPLDAEVVCRQLGYDIRSM